jgi:hypothetical protein
MSANASVTHVTGRGWRVAIKLSTLKALHGLDHEEAKRRQETSAIYVRKEMVDDVVLALELGVRQRLRARLRHVL